MSSNRIGGVQTTPTHIKLHTEVPGTQSTPSQAVTSAPKTSSVNLFDASTYSKAVSVKDGAGSTVSLPTLSDDQLEQAKNLFAKVADDKQNEVNAASAALGQALVQQMLAAPSAQGQLNGVQHASIRAATSATPNSASPAVAVTKVSPGLAAATTGAASTYSQATGASATGTDAVSAATYMGLVGLQGELSSYADDINTTTSQKASLDGDASELNTAISEWPAGTDTQTLPQVVQNKDGTVTVTQVSMTKSQAQASLDSAKSASEALGNDQQIQSIKLQSMMSNYSNAVTQMSNILKAAYDAAKNTLGNVHY